MSTDTRVRQPRQLMLIDKLFLQEEGVRDEIKNAVERNNVTSLHDNIKERLADDPTKTAIKDTTVFYRRQC